MVDFYTLTFVNHTSIPNAVMVSGATLTGGGTYEGLLTIPKTDLLGNIVVGVSDNCFFSEEEEGLFYWIQSLSFEVSNAFTYIGDNSFYSINPSGGTLILPQSVNFIGEKAFYTDGYFDGNLILPSSILTIGDYAFKGNDFSQITLPLSIQNFNILAFRLDYDIVYLLSNTPYAISNPDINIHLQFSPPFPSYSFSGLPGFLSGSDTGLLESNSTITYLNNDSYTFYVTCTTSEEDTFTLNFSLVIDLPAPEAPCFLSCTRLLTISNNSHQPIEKYVPISAIHKGDLVKGVYSGLPIKVVHCGYSPINIDMLAKYNFPRRIPKNFFAENQPEEDIYVSGGHRIIVDKFKIPAAQFQNLDKYEIKTTAEIKEITGQDECRYYHIELENNNEGVFAEGLRVETLEKGWWEKCNFIENI